jgi:hypothetical protein
MIHFGSNSVIFGSGEKALVLPVQNVLILLPQCWFNLIG